MQVTGEVKRPLTEGSIRNAKGRIDLARLKTIICDEEQAQYLPAGEKASDAFRAGGRVEKGSLR